MKADLSWPVVVAEDDPDDYQLLKVAWKRAEMVHPLVRVEDGVALLDYLRQPAAQRAALVLLDAKMPRKSGHETLEEMKADPALRRNPVVMLSTSVRQLDIRRAYELGAASYLVKPDGLAGMAGVVRLLRTYWLEIAELPDE